jgi:hypothetical protein
MLFQEIYKSRFLHSNRTVNSHIFLNIIVHIKILHISIYNYGLLRRWTSIPVNPRRDVFPGVLTEQRTATTHLKSLHTKTTMTFYFIFTCDFFIFTPCSLTRLVNFLMASRRSRHCSNVSVILLAKLNNIWHWVVGIAAKISEK